MKRLPLKGSSWEQLCDQISDLKRHDFNWRHGRLPSYIYFHSEELLAVQRAAYASCFVENNLGKARAFPSLGRMEQDIIEMALSLLGGDEGSGGIFTSGGSESIILAVKSARDWARKQRPGLPGKAKIVASETAHPAFNKAAHLLDMDVVRVPTRLDLRADVAGFVAASDEVTVMMVGSAPQYPNGVFDPIAELAALARDRGCWMHVDSCVGGFLAPFARDLGHPVPPFDLSVEGVFSLSADLHKYGFAPRGASTVLFKQRALRDYATFDFDWPRGTYHTDGLAGSSPGGAVSGAWAVMNHLGVEGYRNLARITLETVAAFTKGIDEIPGLEVVRPFDLCIFSYLSRDPELDINALAEAMVERGWFIGRSRKPQDCINCAVNPVHQPIVDDYLADLNAAAAQVRSSRAKAVFDLGTY